MLDAAVKNSGISDVIDATLSVEEVGVFSLIPGYINWQLINWKLIPLRSYFNPPMPGMPQAHQLSALMLPG